MTRQLILLLFLLALPAAAQTRPAPAAPSPSELQPKVEAYLRNLFAWGPEYKIALGPFTAAPIPGFYQTEVEVTYHGRSDVAALYVSKDGKFLIRGEIQDLAADPYAANRQKIQIAGDPSKGPGDAAVTVVEFSDFECPHCREMFSILQKAEQQFPQVKFVFKDFPLVQIHPWAMTAALAARCAFDYSPQAYWQVQKAIFDNQNTITADNAWSKLLGFAAVAGLQADEYQSCMISPNTKRAVEADIKDGKLLQVNSTPTLFVNGRPLVGGSDEVLEQFINYELALHRAH